jgi:hypothetical protein
MRRPGKRKVLDLSKPLDAIAEEIEQLKASVRAQVEHPFRVNQAAVRAREGALPWVGKEHCAVAHAVRAGPICGWRAGN